MCLINQSEDICDHPECNSFFQSCSFPQGFSNPQLLDSLLMALLCRNSALANLSNLSNEMEVKTRNLTQNTQKDVGTHNSTQKSVFYQQPVYEKKIVIFGELPNMVLKEKGFIVITEVKDLNNQNLLSDKLFKVKLYTNEPSPKALKLNISSKKIMRGTLETKMNSDRQVVFSNIVINEVSSHYPTESFILVISCEDSTVKPLLIENLCVRARNSNKKND